jgi:hypothetical protein
MTKYFANLLAKTKLLGYRQYGQKYFIGVNIMKTFYISVTETLNRIVEVHAEDSSEALQKAEEAYYNEEIVLDSEDFVNTDFNDETEETINNYELGGMPKFYEVK